MRSHRLPLSVFLAALVTAAPARAAEEKDCGCDHGKTQTAQVGEEGHEGHAGMAGHEDHAGMAGHEAHLAAAKAAPSAGAAAKIQFPDEVLLDQDGKSRKLVSDVLGDRIVVMDFIFTTCTTVCPLLSGIMTGVQGGLGDAEDVALVSVTVDPGRDTPERLHAYAAKWHAKPGWTFLTGEREHVKRVLEAAGAYTTDFTAHPPMVLVGDGRTGQWVRLNGFPKRAQVLAEVNALRQRREAVSAAAKGGRP